MTKLKKMDKCEGFIINYDRAKRTILPIFTNVIYWAARIDYEYVCSAAAAEEIFDILSCFQQRRAVEESTFLLMFPKFKKSYEQFRIGDDDVYSIHILPKSPRHVDSRPAITESVTHPAPPTDRLGRMDYFNGQIETLLRETNCATLIEIAFKSNEKKNISITVQRERGAIAHNIPRTLLESIVINILEAGAHSYENCFTGEEFVAPFASVDFILDGKPL